MNYRQLTDRRRMVRRSPGAHDAAPPRRRAAAPPRRRAAAPPRRRAAVPPPRDECDCAGQAMSSLVTKIGSQQKQSPEEGILEGGPIPLYRDTTIYLSIFLFLYLHPSTHISILFLSFYVHIHVHVQVNAYVCTDTYMYVIYIYIHMYMCIYRSGLTLT